jgi:hypothetical protein
MPELDAVQVLAAKVGTVKRPVLRYMPTREVRSV